MRSCRLTKICQIRRRMICLCVTVWVTPQLSRIKITYKTASDLQWTPIIFLYSHQLILNMFRTTRYVLYPLLVRKKSHRFPSLRLDYWCLKLSLHVRPSFLGWPPTGFITQKVWAMVISWLPEVIFMASTLLSVTSELSLTFLFRSQDRGPHGRQHNITHLFTCNVRLDFIFLYFFVNSHLLRLGSMMGSVDIVAAEHGCIWIIWIFLLITAALVTVCSRHFSFAVVLTPSYRGNFLISNTVEATTKSAVFSRLSKRSLGFAGVFYPSSSSLLYSSSCWAAMELIEEQIAGLGAPLLLILRHAKLPPPPPSTINPKLRRAYQLLMERRINSTLANLLKPGVTWFDL